MSKNAFVLMFLFIIPSLVYSIPDTLLVNNNQQLLVQFPTSIEYVDLGSDNILGRKWNNETALSLMSLNPEMESTTISLVTSDGNYYSYVLKFGKDLPALAYDIKDGVIQSQKVGVSASKTTHFIANEDIVDIIVGNDSIIADNASGIKNIAKIRSLSRNIDKASFTIITKSGKIIPYELFYEETPVKHSIYIENTDETAIFSETPLDKNKLDEIAKSVVKIKPKYNHLGDLDHNMIFSLDGIYSVENYLVFHLHLENRNNIDYDIDFLKTYVRDKKSTKYVALQEQEIYPFYMSFSNENYKSMLPGEEKVEIVLFFTRFTIPKSRLLCFEIFENNGGRHLEFSVSNKEILKAQKINNLNKNVATNASNLHLIHVEGIHSIGVRGGTALFNTWDIGINYNYCMHRRWVWNTGVDYEEGMFGQSIYRGVTVSPGVEFAVWQPCSWLFLNLTTNLNLGWDEWKHKELKTIEDAFAVGASVGVNLEAYLTEYLSILLEAEQKFIYRCPTQSLEGKFYCRPLFSLGIRAHIR